MRQLITRVALLAALLSVSAQSASANRKYTSKPAWSGSAIQTSKPSATKKTTKKGTRMSDSKKFRLFNPETMAKPAAGYSHVAEVTGGKMIYTAGQVAIDSAGNIVGRGDFRAQVEQVFQNLKSAVEAGGANFHDVIKLNFYCAANVDPSQLPAVREVRDKFVNTANPPVSTFVFVSRLVNPDWLIEVEAVAVAPH